MRTFNRICKIVPLYLHLFSFMSSNLKAEEDIRNQNIKIFEDFLAKNEKAFVVPVSKKDQFCSQPSGWANTSGWTQKWPAKTAIKLGNMIGYASISSNDGEAENQWLVDCLRCGIAHAIGYIKKEFCEQHYPEIGWNKTKDEIKAICKS